MFAKAAPRRLSLTALLACCSLLAAFGVRATASIDVQRAAFKQAWAAAQQGGDGWHAWDAQLRSYPLYPYLPAAALEHDIQQIDLPTVQAYLAQYPDLIPAQDLRRDFLLELARRQDWNSFLALYQPGSNDALTCDALQARMANGATLDFDRDLAALWAKPDLPGACTPVLQAAHDQGLLTTPRLWSRIEGAADAGKGGTISVLANWLPAPQNQEAQWLAQALRDPQSAMAAAASWPDTAHARMAASLALQSVARRDTDNADAAWQQLRTHFSFSPSQRDAIRRALAIFHASDYDPDALQQLIALPSSAQTATTREWRVRVALAAQDWPGVLAGIAAMPADQQQGDEWRWFRARALAATGHAEQAQAVYADLAKQTTFFGYLAADQANQPYAICPRAPIDDPQQQQALLAQPGLQRAFELFAVGLQKQARREWTRALDGSDERTQVLAVELADARGWYDRAAFTLNHDEAMHYYTLRLPLDSQIGVVEQAKQSGIDPAWAYGILRSESAWMSDARSGADARGLMQLVPSSAAAVARSNGMAWTGGDSLYDPATNVALGTRYLAQLAERYNGAPWLASAAYNAGPGRVNQWLAARSSLAPDLFIATIPFKETREYVARVMDYSLMYDWRLHGNALSIATRLTPIGQLYALPNSMTPRKAVGCPVVAAPTAPASSVNAPATAASVAIKASR
ncbi:transglycosylase SLT domain-containing protein [Rhodanobacter sp. DHG33]|uniref:transglycosylase SLT domain-containing protein n=1 Tax=Rhodanobacter sp. DHG33 TaxID=2775921 RepID=UPI001786499B|nr:transglycosylase SLT domain-containing protein [Rhodanobacter sp. DHG33]MBD8897732.1 transglycosylase SLT domain-containing protein [Rhodanobacter sp. DHG33]